MLVNLINEAGAFPPATLSEGRFEGAGKISGESARHDTIVKHGGKTTHSGCTTCIIQCSNMYNDANGKYLTSGLEYETVWANGANCGIDDLDSIALVSYLCDSFGLDTIEVGDAIAVAMYAGLKAFGDTAGAVEMVHEIGKGTPLGGILGSGAWVVAARPWRGSDPLRQEARDAHIQIPEHAWASESPMPPLRWAQTTPRGTQ